MRMIFWVLSCAALAAFSPALAEEDLPKGVTLITPDKIQWVKTPSGRELAYLHGHPDKPGPYLYLVKWPPNNKALAHKHPDDRYGIVLSGTHYIGYGDRFDEKKLHAHPAGSYFTEPANTAHFGLTRGEGAVLYFYGVGPSGNMPLEK
ncbi:MAG TPA: cupin domain-containing protein [Burkholderiales bacterium]|nr:cupin domain-containing protein [Burkholderiales bacterium]